MRWVVEFVGGPKDGLRMELPFPCQRWVFPVKPASIVARVAESNDLSDMELRIRRIVYELEDRVDMLHPLHVRRIMRYKGIE